MTDKEVQQVKESKGVSVNDLLAISVGEVAQKNPSSLSSVVSSIEGALSYLSNEKPPNNELIAQLNAKLREIENALKPSPDKGVGGKNFKESSPPKEFREAVANEKDSVNRATASDSVGFVNEGGDADGLSGGERYSSFNWASRKPAAWQDRIAKEEENRKLEDEKGRS